MQPNSTLKTCGSPKKKFLKIFARLIILLPVFILFTKNSNAQVLYNEGFNTVVPLPAGWASQNLSSPVGSTGWFQGNNTVFPAQSGAPTAYIGANFNNTTGANIISNWLFMPNVTIKNGDVFTFWTRTITTPTFADRLQVRMSLNGASTNAGATSASVGDFTTLLLDINPTLTPSGYPNVWTQFTVNITGVAVPTSGRLAFRYFVNDGGPGGSNSDYIGIDEAVYTTTASPCSGAPVPGNTLSSVPAVCPATNFTLSLENNPPLSGLSYQWQSGPSVTGPWANGGPNASTWVTSLAATTFYRCIVTCSAGPSSGTSTPVQVALNPPTACYCIPTYTNGCSGFGDFVSRVVMGTLNNTSVCTGTPFYTYYSAVAAPSLIAGATYPIACSFGPDGTQFFGAWADFNQDGDFTDAGEYLGTSGNAGANGTISINALIPATATLGTTRLRIRGGDDTGPSGTQSCGASNSSFGETEDYTITVEPCVPGGIYICAGQCNNTVFPNATFTVAATGSALSYSWQYRTSAAGSWLTVPNGGIYSGATTTTLTLTNVSQTIQVTNTGH